MSRTTVLDIAVFTCSECQYKTSMQNVTMHELTTTVRSHVDTHQVEKDLKSYPYDKTSKSFFMSNPPVDASGPDPIRSLYENDPTAYFIKRDGSYGHITDGEEVIDVPVADSKDENK